jgi:Flp pilus assembly protein TadD
LDEITALLQRRDINPADRIKMRMTRGYVCETLGNIEEARRSYSVLADDPQVDPVWRIRALQTRAALFIQQGKTDSAVDDLRKILTLPDPSGEFHQKARFVLGEMGR